MSERRLPPEIYWRRRLVALAVIILLVWGALQVVSHLRDGGSDTKVAPTPASTTPPTAEPAPVVTDGVVKVALASSVVACDPEKIVVTPAVAGGQHTGGPVEVQMSIGTTQKTPCAFDAQKADLLVVISANKAPIWDSSVCKSSFVAGTVQVSPTWSTVVPTTWTGRGSGKKCSSKEGYASPGTYVLKTATLGGEPGQTTFHLTNPPKPKPTQPSKTPTGKPTEPTAKPTKKG